MIKKISKLFSLSKINIKSSFQNPYLFDKKTGKLNKKSIFLWLIIILMIFFSYISFDVVQVLDGINQPTIFLNLIFLILFIVMIFQLLLASSNVYFFSKDFESLLPLPIKSEELLISKFNTLLINMYFTEFVFALFPLITYGFVTYSSILYYIELFMILLIFPILPILIVSIFTMIFIKIFKFIKKPEILQIIIIFVFLLIFVIFSFKIVNKTINNSENITQINEEAVLQSFSNFNNKIYNINSYFLGINPVVEVLDNYNNIKSIVNILKIILINCIFFVLFIFIGNKYYLKNILKNNIIYIKKTSKNHNNKKLKRSNKAKSYIMKEIKLIKNNHVYFIQCIMPLIIIMVSILLITIFALPNIRDFIDKELNGKEIFFDLGTIGLILGLIQIIMTISNISITSISREGIGAYYMKSLPIDFYKQYIYKTIPQIIINAILISIILIFVKLVLPIFSFANLLLTFVLANLLNILNSELMVLVDLYRPNLNWKEYYEAVSQNNNKLFQYVLTIVIILALVYFKDTFSDLKLEVAGILIMAVIIFIIFIINIIVRTNIKKLYKNIK